VISLGEQIAEAQRELPLRRKCYPAWVKSGKLDAGDDKYQLQGMEEIARTLMRLDAEQRQLSSAIIHPFLLVDGQNLSNVINELRTNE
jgi:hypothetical protein